MCVPDIISRSSIVFFQSATMGEDVEEEIFDARTKMSAARELVSVRLGS
jgi:hypothetical protein